MAKGTLQIHSENILPIIKKWLYSEKDIFVRELVSNACDAIQKVKILRDQNMTTAKDEDFRVEIKIDKQARTLTFTDTGIGMDAEEVQNYIAQIAFSGAEEFVSKYKTQNEKDQFIGHFGLGFYSAYMVAEKVEINTLSYKEGAKPVFWSCDGTSEYTLEEGTRQTRGTEIILHIDKENDEYLEETRLNNILNHYCAFLPYPVYLGINQINTKEPIWIKAPSECTQQDYLEFYRYLFPMEDDPLFWVHLNVDYPFHLKGILYFPKIKPNFDTNKSTIKLYCNRVFVSDNCKDLIPDYLMVLRGIIDSPDIPLNISRSYLQMDRTVRLLASHISKKVSDSLGSLFKSDKNRFLDCWNDISPVVKLGVAEDEKFYERSKDFLLWKDINGEWITIDEYLEKNKEKTKGTIFYTKDDQHSTHMLNAYKDKGIDVLCMDSPIDQYVIQSLERKLSPTTFKRIDSDVHEHLVDTSRESTLLDAEGKTEAARLSDFIKGKLENPSLTIEAKSLNTDSLPAFVTIDENQRRLRDYLLYADPKQAKELRQMMGKQTFVVNMNSPLIKAIHKLDTKNPEMAKDMLQEVYDLTLLSQREMDPGALPKFIERSNSLLEKLAQQIAG